MKKWLIGRFLPMWAKETLLREYRALTRENAALQGENRQLRAYIRGLQAGLRRHRREETHEHP